MQTSLISKRSDADHHTLQFFDFAKKKKRQVGVTNSYVTVKYCLPILTRISWDKVALSMKCRLHRSQKNSYMHLSYLCYVVIEFFWYLYEEYKLFRVAMRIAGCILNTPHWLINSASRVGTRLSSALSSLMNTSNLFLLILSFYRLP
jgi:hypothetical protein